MDMLSSAAVVVRGPASLAVPSSDMIAREDGAEPGQTWLHGHRCTGLENARPGRADLRCDVKGHEGRDLASLETYVCQQETPDVRGVDGRAC
jgi:hypothetical protein